MVEFDRHHDHPHSQFNLGVIDAEACLFDKDGTLLRLLGVSKSSGPGLYDIAGPVQFDRHHQPPSLPVQPGGY